MPCKDIFLSLKKSEISSAEIMDYPFVCARKKSSDDIRIYFSNLSPKIANSMQTVLLKTLFA